MGRARKSKARKTTRNDIPPNAVIHRETAVLYYHVIMGWLLNNLSGFPADQEPVWLNSFLRRHDAIMKLWEKETPMSISIWARFLKTNKIEKIDTCKPSEADNLVREYAMAFRGAAVVWAGKKSDYEKSSVICFKKG